MRSKPYPEGGGPHDGPLHFDIVLHHVQPGNPTFILQSLSAGSIADYRHSIVAYDINSDVYFETNDLQAVVCNRNKTMYAKEGVCILTPNNVYGYDKVVEAYT